MAGDAPMNYLTTAGPRADPATALLWGLIVLSVAVSVIVTVLVVAGVAARRRRGAVHEMADEPAARGPSALAWFYLGMPLTVLALVAALIWTIRVLAAVDSPPTRPHLTIEITGHQWWWEARYLSADPNQTFITANELHVPVGQPVLIKLVSADVVHSFWIPALSGKTDAIPGQLNIAWLQADRPGVFEGQCGEYCGLQHAHMGLLVLAEPAAQFGAWRENQLRLADATAAGPAAAGKALFVSRCGSCHAVRGTAAGGIRGPDLTHLMSRQTLAAGAVPNTVGGLSGWISNPQALKPGALMPATWLSGSDLQATVAYLQTLK
jgi:cytochrome c oxidase subunit II